MGDSLIDSCKREVKEEINGDIEIIKPLNPMIIYKKSSDGKRDEDSSYSLWSENFSTRAKLNQ